MHDIGKSLDHEFEGTHGQNGAALAKKYGEGDAVINAIEVIHDDAEPASPIAVLVEASDAISKSRPGARREVLENYVRRLESLEQTARTIEGVNEVYVVQAGQEIRVIANSGQTSDEDIQRLAAKITDRLTEIMTYPGQVRVTVIREIREINFAR